MSMGMSNKVEISGSHGGEMMAFAVIAFMVWGDPDIADKLKEYLMAWLDANTQEQMFDEKPIQP